MAAEPRDASTVILLRDSDAGPEVFISRRVSGMEFAPGMTVFPGGRVDEGDDDPGVSWSGPSPDWWSERFSVATRRARALVCAAVRETFEECGVLLAATPDGELVRDVGPFVRARRALEAEEITLPEFLAAEGLVLAAGRLRPADHWITPRTEKRRYDTRFFLARLPEGQDADDDTSEVDHTEWIRPEAALAEFAAGGVMILPPTWVQLRRLADAADVDEAMATERAIIPVEPEIVDVDGRPRTVFDGSEDYWDALRRGRPRLFD